MIDATSTSFVRNEWHVVALASELGEQLISRIVHGRSVLLYRKADGRPVALDNRCSHRGYPLAKGARRGDGVECGYHGFAFDSAGRCVSVPGQTAIPSKAAIRSFPVIESGPFVWMWTGDGDEVGPTTAPDSVGFGADGWSFYTGYSSIGCSYMLVVDNLLDLSHESFLHATRIGTPEVAETPIATEADEAAGTVSVRRHMQGVECPPSYEELTGLRTPIDRTQDIRFFAPTLYVLSNRLAPAGLPVGEPGAFHTRVVYALTPQDARTTHYFFAIGRDFAQDDRNLDEIRRKSQYELIAEDADALELLQQTIETEGPASEVSIKIDTGALAARRLIRRRLDAEAEAVA